MYRTSPSPAGTCPRCREALLDIQGVSGTRWCDRCGGVFADVAASQRIVSTLDRTLLEIGFQASLGQRSKPDDTRAITCPECLIEMVRTRIESANCVIDACPSHGTWFDTGELVDVIRALRAARKRRIFHHAAADDVVRSESDGERELDLELEAGSVGLLARWIRRL